MFIVLIIYVLVFSILILTEYNKKFKKYHVFFKGLTSFIFLSTALYFAVGYSGPFSNLFQILMCIALFFCLVGDVFLSIVSGRSDSWFFVLGVVSFAAAHVIFFVAFGAVVPITIVDILTAVVIAILCFGITKLKIIDIQDKKALILAYSVFLGLLMAKGITVLVDFGTTQFAIIAFLGATLFFVSDVILLFILFSTRKIKILTFLNLLTYYSATMLLAYLVGV